MKLIDLIKKSNKDKTIEMLFDNYFKIYSLPTKFNKNDYMKAISELEKMPYKNTSGIIIVYPMYKFNDNDEIILDDFPVIVDDFDINDLSSINNLDYEKISEKLFIKNWSDILSYDIFDKSIKEYGCEFVLSKILLELFWFGLSDKEHKENRKKEKKRITQNIVDNDVLLLFKELDISYEPNKINISFQENIDKKNEVNFNNFVKS